MLAERVERVAFRQSPLDRYELAARIALEADEDQPRILKAVRVRARVVRVRSAQHFRAPVPLGAGESGVGGGRCRVEAFVAVAPPADARLLIGQADPVPGV